MSELPILESFDKPREPRTTWHVLRGYERSDANPPTVEVFGSEADAVAYKNSISPEIARITKYVDHTEES